MAIHGSDQSPLTAIGGQSLPSALGGMNISTNLLNAPISQGATIKWPEISTGFQKLNADGMKFDMNAVASLNTPLQGKARG
ncbi:hypothetical protein [Candidatus Deianiraea vastatrix]|uniref:Uncharacterized protein n=1 Tax=Candidatus Deianiraea vastatrix TaxID=2163644 RepID=A0A5B8XHM4_9RICK|nr:hypothetical protein [Candidatus Deianiraea vastatrix]QED23581.1 hypothetical protein Deia_00793 [Candidatus Deianiraea vastatrix]